MSVDLILKQANDCYLNGAYQEAERLYRMVLGFVGENSDILNMLGLVAAAKGEHETALGYYNDALKNTLQPVAVYFNMAVSLNMLQKYDAAINAYQNVLRLAPDTKEAYNNMGAIYEKQGLRNKALGCYQKAIELDSSYMDALVNYAVLQDDIQTLENLAKKYKNEALPFYHLALYAFDKQNYSKALDNALIADSLAEAPEIKNLVAQCYLNQNDNENALKFFHQLLLSDKKNVDALINCGILENDEDYFKKAISLYPKNYKAHLAYADFLYKNDRTIEAIEMYHQALLLNADDAALSNNVALILKDLGDEQGALDLMLNAFMKSPENMDISVNIAETLVLLYQKNPAEAKRIAKLWHNMANDNVFATKTLNAFENIPSFNDKEYAKALFDEFADVYDATMQKINYAVFEKIKALHVNTEGKILDLGCATGIGAVKLKSLKSVWTGVDISSRMLQKAKKTGLYQQLIQADAIDFLQKNREQFDVIFCLDVIEYVQNLADFLTPDAGKLLILSFEKAPDSVLTWRLSPFGRYQHNPSYIKEILSKNGYKNIDIHALMLRKENGKDVDGFLALAS